MRIVEEVEEVKEVEEEGSTAPQMNTDNSETMVGTAEAVGWRRARHAVPLRCVLHNWRSCVCRRVVLAAADAVEFAHGSFHVFAS